MRISDWSSDVCSSDLLTDDEIVSLATEAADSTWSAAERRVIAMVDELSAKDVVSEPTWEAMRADWDDKQPVELLLLPGFSRMLAGFLHRPGVRVESDAPDLTHAPDGPPGAPPPA